MNALLQRLAGLQDRRPGAFALAALLVVAGAVPLLMRLGLNGDLTALLPSHAASVVDLETLKGRFGIASTLSVAVHGDDVERVRAFTRALGEDLERDPPPRVRWTDWNVGEFIAFVEQHKFLYVDLADLTEVEQALADRIQYEKQKANPLFVSLDDPPPEPQALIDKLKAREERAKQERDRFPGGYFQHQTEKLCVMFLRTAIQSGEMPAAQALIDDVRARAARLSERADFAGVQVELGGDLMDMMEETRALAEEALWSTAATIVLVLATVFLFFLTWRSIPLLALQLIPPVALTFGVAWLTVGSLNTSTAFLGSIVIGNGINSGIIWLARYHEERRAGHSTLEALQATHLGTWAGTLAASSAAAIAYGSLIITDFRGFHDFGVIGGVGMLLCWLSTMLGLPAFAVLFDRLRPIEPRAGARANLYGRFFADLAQRAPRPVVWVALLGVVASGLLIARFVAGDPMEYDFRKLQSVRDKGNRVQWVNDRQGEIVDEVTTGSGIAIVADSREGARELVRKLQELAKTQPNVLGAVRSLDDLLPGDQDRKLELLARVRKHLLDLEPYADDKQRAEIQRYLPPEQIPTVADTDVPAQVTRLYTQLDGTLGHVVYVEHHPSQNHWDGKYLVRWSEAVRSVTAVEGHRPPVTGRPPVFADLLDSILIDGPRAVAAALLVVVALVLLTFRSMADRLLTLIALLIGVAWMTGAMALLDIKLNFLNFVAFPITFGIGVDYAVNTMKRWLEEKQRHGDVPAAVVNTIESTGGAVILCSLTTVIGYISLFASSNLALNSFGEAMAISEVTCLLAAILVLPAYLWLRASRR